MTLWITCDPTTRILAWSLTGAHLHELQHDTPDDQDGE